MVEIASLSDVVEGNVLLFMEDGRELRNEVLVESWERGGAGASSTVSSLSPCSAKPQWRM